MGDEQARTVFCLTCRKLVPFVEDDVKEREQRSTCDCKGDTFETVVVHAATCAAKNPPQVVDYIICDGCKDPIPLGLPRFRSQPGPTG